PAILLEGLQRLEYRGYDSDGLAVIREGGGFEVRRKVGKVRELKEDLETRPVAGRIGIAHTRWATHGVPSEVNAHPHVSRGRICVVHNGIIENYEELRAELRGRGYTFASDTDSEVIAHLIDACYEPRGGAPGRGALLEAVRSA